LEPGIVTRACTGPCASGAGQGSSAGTRGSLPDCATLPSACGRYAASKDTATLVDEFEVAAVVHAATSLTWTRDPFDRMIVADAIVAASDLLTKDEQILTNAPFARW